MADLQTHYTNFHNKIKLSRESENYRKAREKDDLITPKVKKALNDAGFNVVDHFLQGSMKTNTGIIPLDGDYDIDRAIVIDTDSEDPVEAKKVIRDTLLKHGFIQPKIKKPCVTADYQADNIHIDYPLYRQEAWGELTLGVGKEFASDDNKYWDESAPKELISWINDCQCHQDSWNELTSDERSQFIRITRALKRWRDEKFNDADASKIYSIALTVMIKESFMPSVNDNGKANDHEALRDTLDVILNKKSYFVDQGDGSFFVSVKLPVTPYRDIFHENSKTIGTKLKNKLQVLNEALEEVDQLDDLHEQTKILEKHFGEEFPVANETVAENNANDAPAIVGVSTGA